MKLDKIKEIIFITMAATIIGIGFGSISTQAQSRFVNRHPRPIYRPFYHRAYDPFWSPWGPWDRTVTVIDPIAQQREAGYSDGHKRGKDDAKHNQANSPESHKHYAKSNSLAYRQAFLKGYADGYHEQMNREG